MEEQPGLHKNGGAAWSPCRDGGTRWPWLGVPLLGHVTPSAALDVSQRASRHKASSARLGKMVSSHSCRGLWKTGGRDGENYLK